MSVPSAGRFPRLAWILAAGFVVLLTAVAVWAYLHRPQPAPPATDDPLALTPLSASPYLNTRPEAAYVGSAACTRCHPTEHESYHRTGMSKSTLAVDLKEEPPDGSFDHPASGRRYEAHREGDQLWHRELSLRGGQAGLVLNDYPLHYVTGSGRHSRTYLTEVDGFLLESPLTWYAALGRWGMSPGYDRQAQIGFERPIGNQCLYCHVGRYEVLDRSFHRHRIQEVAVGCERCHGPGSAHVAYQEPRAGQGGGAGGDLTIVNPRRLTRELAESICQQCHLAGDAMILARGRKLTDFRPGLPLQDVQLLYRLNAPSEAMTVTGHVEQLHQSRCYQKSGSLTCSTCHDPHHFPEEKQRVAYYRDACLKCHAEKACTVDPHQREKESPDNSCVHCHMPGGATDIPHVAFSHHRIGIHGAPEPYRHELPAVDPFGGVEALVPLHDLSRYSALDRKRALGLAYAKVGGHPEMAQAVRPYNERAHKLLAEVWEAGLRDGPVATALATSTYMLGGEDVRTYAEAALRDPDLEGQNRCDALFLLGDAAFKKGQYAEAAEYLRQVTQLRRTTTDWTYLARCEQGRGDEPEALKAWEMAARISPANARLHRDLAELYDRKGDRARADWHRQRIPPDADK